MTAVKSTDLLVNKANLREYRFAEQALPAAEDLSANQVILKIDLFSFTSNNITYAAVGETMHYWDFFPAETGWGKVPCWGYAEVVHSLHPDIEAGERLYGYYPMSSHLIVEAGRVNETGFYDVSIHRQPLPVIYNHYVRTKNDIGYRPEYEGLNSLFQPLFATSFLLDDYLHEKDFFGGRQIICTSASSKTSIAFAYLLHHQREQRAGEYHITGLTSARNETFVRSLGIYDEVYTYDGLDNIEKSSTSIVVDFAGNKSLLLDLQEQQGESLKYFCNVGLSHWEDSSAEGSLKVPSEFFFAPAQAEKRTHDWGGAGLRERMAGVYIPFLAYCSSWMTIRSVSGSDGVGLIYDEMIEGKVNPAEGIVATFNPGS